MCSFIKICLICIIRTNRLKEHFTENPGMHVKLLIDTILKGTHQRTISARFGLLWLSGFRGDLNVKVYHVVQQMDAKWWQKLTQALAKKTECQIARFFFNVNIMIFFSQYLYDWIRNKFLQLPTPSPYKYVINNTKKNSVYLIFIKVYLGGINCQLDF